MCVCCVCVLCVCTCVCVCVCVCVFVKYHHIVCCVNLFSSFNENYLKTIYVVIWTLFVYLFTQVVISHDLAFKMRLTKYGGSSYGYILKNIVPYMLKRGFTEQDITTMLVETPKRLLTII